MTRLLEPLEREGLVARAASEADRRVVLAQLTEAGRRRLTAARRTHRDIAALCAGRFEAGGLEALDRLLARLLEVADEADWAT